MQTRRFGRTGHMSSIAIFGTFAFSKATQAEADVTMPAVIAAGVNHVDVAPSYGQAEERIGPWLARERDRFFVGCKTTQRSKDGAAAELRASLKRLQVDAFDLYQIHAVTNLEQLDEATRPGGALDAILEARDAGLTRWIGITGHGEQAPAVFLEALRRFDFDSVLFPISLRLYADAKYRAGAEALLRECRARDVGTMIIKSISHEPWGSQAQTTNTWYKPFFEPERIQQAVNFVLSQDVTGLCTAGDMRLLPDVLRACENFMPLDATRQAELVASAASYASIFA